MIPANKPAVFLTFEPTFVIWAPFAPSVMGGVMHFNVHPLN